MNIKSILLAYATLFGSTQEVAEAIATALREAGFEVELQPMQEVQRLDGYDAVVLGAAIYNTHWHQDAHKFLSQYQETLCQLPVAIFALGPLSASEAATQRSRHQLAKEPSRYPWLKPVVLEMFVGKLDPAELGFFERFGARASDHWDWNAIRAWANALVVQLEHNSVLSPS